MKKNFFKLLLTTFSLVFLLLIASCGKKVDLSELRQEAISEIENYVNEEDYSTDNYKIIKGIIAEAKVDIYEADTADKIDEVVIKAKADIDEVENSTQALEEFKEDLIAQLSSFGNETNYSEGKWNEIQTLIDAKKATIRNATSTAAANQAYNQAILELNQVDNIDVEYAKGRLATISIPQETIDDFEIIETEAGSDYIVHWSVIQGAGITLNGTTASVLRAFEDVDVIIKVSFLKNQNVVYSQEFIVTVLKKVEVLINVSDIKDYKVGESVLVTGLVVGTGSNGNTGGQEVIIKDLETFEYIGVRKLPGTFPDFSVVKGDIIEFSGLLRASTTDSEVGKVFIEYDERLVVKSSNNEVLFDLEGALEIKDQKDLEDLIIEGKFYTFAKITTSVYSNKYGSTYETYYNRFTLDPNNKTFASIKINDAAPALKHDYSRNNIGGDWVDLMFGITEENFASITGTYPGIEFKGEVYVFYLGGNTYYHQFIILDGSHIVPAPDNSLNEAKEAAIVDLNAYLNTFDEENYTPENWVLLNGEVLASGILAINEAETIEEVTIALNNAKAAINDVEVIVEIIYDVEFILPTKVVYHLNEPIDLTDGKVIFRLDGEIEHEASLTASMVTGFDSSKLGDKLVLTINYAFSGETYTETYEIDVLAYNVNEVKALEANTESIFRGIVVGTGSNGNAGAQEVIIKDLETFEYVGVRKMPGAYPKYDVVKGDIVEFKGKVIVSTGQAEAGKVLLEYVSDLEIVSSENEVIFDLEGALEIANQDDIISLLNSGDYYQFVKITTSIYSNKYGSAYEAYFNRFTLDQNNKSFAAIKVNDLSLVLKNDYSFNNIGEDWTDLMFGINEDNFADITGSYPGIEFEGEVYVFYLGGNSYYYQFIIFELDHINPMPGKKLAEAKIVALAELNEYLMTFEEENYTPENWTLLNGEALDAAKLVINEAETVEEVLLALESAKNILKNVESIIVYDVELVVPEKLEYFLGEELDLTGGKLVFKLDDEVVFEEELTLEMANGFNSDEVVSDLVITIEYLYAGELYVKVFNINVIERPPVSVSEIKDLTVGEILVFEGLVVGTAGNGNVAGNELIIKDLETFEYIGVRNMPGEFPVYTVSKGDSIKFVGKVMLSSAKGEVGKIYLDFESDLEVLSSDNKVIYDLDGALEIANQADLVNLINDGPSYQFIKVTTSVYSNKYGGTYETYYNRFTLDPANNSLAKIKVNDITPVIRNSYSSNNIGEGWTDTMFGLNEDNFADITGTYPGIEYDGVVYLMYVGGNSYYHQFVIFDITHIISNE